MDEGIDPGLHAEGGRGPRQEPRPRQQHRGQEPQGADALLQGTEDPVGEATEAAVPAADEQAERLAADRGLHAGQPHRGQDPEKRPKVKAGRREDRRAGVIRAAARQPQQPDPAGRVAGGAAGRLFNRIFGQKVARNANRKGNIHN